MLYQPAPGLVRLNGGIGELTARDSAPAER
jgi:hypothetical protein